MSLQRRMGLGVTLGVDIAQSTNYTALGNIVNAIKNNGTKADTADLSILSDTYKQFGKGQIDPGEWDFEIATDPLDNSAASANTFARILTMHAATGVNTYPFSLQLPSIPSPGSATVAYCNFAAHVIGVGMSVEKDKLIVTPVKLKVSGNPGF